MKNTLKGFLVFCLLTVGVACFLCGCSDDGWRRKKPGVYVSEGKGKTLAEMSSGDVVVIVNGEKITKEDFDALLRVRTAIFQLQRKYDIEDLKNGEVRQFIDMTRPYIVMELIHHKMFAQYAKEKGIVPSAEEIAKARDEFARSLGRRVEDVDRCVKRLGRAAGEVLARVPYVNAQDALLRRSVATNDIDNVTEAELARLTAHMEKWNKTASDNNAESKGRLAKARAEIDAGVPFADVAKKYSQVHPEHGAKWETLELGELPQDEDLYKWLAKAKVGEISPPLDLEDGLAIVKLVSIGKGDAPRGVPKPDVYTLVRCTAYAYQYVEQLDRPKKIREILNEKRSAAQKKLGMMLTERAVLEYPNGKNFFGAETGAAR